MDQANDQKDNGEGEGSEGMSDKTIRELKEGDNGERENAIARLVSIPSEIEVMLFLHDQGKILYHNGTEYEHWMNRDNGVDIVFSDGEYPEGKTDMAFIDVKNVDLREDGKNYNNLIIEVSKMRYGVWDHQSTWGSFYTDGSTNRYIAYVRDGKKYGGKSAIELDAFSLDKTEEENARDIIRYYAENKDLLDHDIYIVRGPDISKSIADKREEFKTADEGRRRKLVTVTKEGKMIYFEQLPNWKLKYPLLEVRRTAEGWTTRHTGNGTFEVDTKQAQNDISANDSHTAKEVERNMKARFEDLRNEQQGGLTAEELLKIHGIYEIPSEDEIIQNRQK